MTAVLQTCLPPVSIPGGLAGFPDLESFALTQVPGARPLLRLTSTDQPDVAFVVSPIVVNRSDGRPAQVIAEGDHSVRAPLRP